MRNPIWVRLGVIACVLGCGGERVAKHGADGFAVGVMPLTLLPAPGGLCEGGGADKECGPDGCATMPQTTPPGAATPTAPGQGLANPSSAPSQPGLPAQMAPAGAQPPMNSTPEVASAPPLGGSSAQADAGTPSDAGCAPLPAAGSDGGMRAACDAGVADAGVAGAVDAGPRFGLAGAGGGNAGRSGSAGEPGVGQAQAALALGDVPTCKNVDAGEATKLFMSADDSNSMAGPVIARRMIELGRPVPAHVIRAWEFLNYYDFAFEPAAPGEVRIVPQLSTCPENGRLSLQVALQAEKRSENERKPLNVTFVMDTSGSMGSNELGGERPIDVARAAVLALASRLQQGDIVSMVTWNTAQLEILSGHPISGPNDPTLVAAARALAPDGGTDLHSGLVRGYDLAHRNATPERINRIILISDGIANVGVIDEQFIAGEAADEERDTGIYLAGIGVGAGINDTLMNTVTDAGRGAYVYLDSSAEAERMLGGRYLQVVDVAARSVRLELTLPYYLTVEKFYGEVVSTDPAKVRPQHLGPNDAMLFFQVLRACDPQLMRGDDRILMRATWKTPFARDAREATLDTTLNALGGDDANLTKAAAIAGYADALLTASSPRLPPEAKLAALQHALDTVRSAKGADSDPDLKEVARLLAMYATQFGQVSQDD